MRWASDYFASRRRVVAEAPEGAAAFECARSSPDGGSTSLQTPRLYKVHVPLTVLHCKGPGRTSAAEQGKVRLGILCSNQVL
ncbi:unnamed protein product [Nippostrongylus brasiliensis]|uniref:Uncharacterized protein n=1 Tax=Nippostrongylus brasiliensis TaxID=27835 RepID=A0A0N4YNW9_NIPBR|nr:unnamed protein product [Nippostrongylus brasiliensis]